MTIELDRLARALEPGKTVLFFGAGSSMPSGSPSVEKLIEKFAERFKVPAEGFGLAEVSELAELKTNRKEVISLLRSQFPPPNPTGGLLNIPIYGWRGIYTTNYDELIERAYEVRRRSCNPITTDYDFSKAAAPDAQPLYKIHGTLGADISDNCKSRIILTQSDYDRAIEYRELIYSRFAGDLAGADLVVIGYSLTDPEIRAVVDRVLTIQSKLAGAAGQIFLLLYVRDENRALLWEQRGVRVAFGGIDEFSEALTRTTRSVDLVDTTSEDPLQRSSTLSATTIDVKHSLSAFGPNASAMFNGWPATYSDIAANLTFQRTIASTLYDKFSNDALQFASIIGANGVGKSTAARQVAVQLEQKGWFVYEHKTDFELPVDDWCSMPERLETLGRNALLIIDDAHRHLRRINQIVERIVAKDLRRLRILLVAQRSQWQFRFKVPPIARKGVEHVLSKLNTREIDRLITLVSASNDIRPLVGGNFLGFSLQEKKSRLIDRCEADAFVCLRNIFARDAFDNIILQEYAGMSEQNQDIYKLVAAMEHAGIRVHRQLVVRLTGIAAQDIQIALANLIDVVSEYDVSTRFGVYGWRVRHAVIAGIIARYKFSRTEERVKLFEDVIKNISPTYEIERSTIREICNVDTGLPSIPDKDTQNVLLRRLISIAPGEAVPRHRLIRNLISIGSFDLAETEIRVFKKDIGYDGTIARYEVLLLIARANDTPGIMDEDRLVLIERAVAYAAVMVERFRNNRNVHVANCDATLELYKRTNNSAPFDEALQLFRAAETRTGDEDMTRSIQSYERRLFQMRL